MQETEECHNRGDIRRNQAIDNYCRDSRTLSAAVGVIRVDESGSDIVDLRS